MLLRAGIWIARGVPHPGDLPPPRRAGQYPAYVRAVCGEVPGATHIRRVLRRASGPDTTPIARSHVPTADRLRPMRGLQSIRTRQCIVAGVELARSVQRGHVTVSGAPTAADRHHVRVRTAAAVFDWLRTVCASPPDRGATRAAPRSAAPPRFSAHEDIAVSSEIVVERVAFRPILSGQTATDSASRYLILMAKYDQVSGRSAASPHESNCRRPGLHRPALPARDGRVRHLLVPPLCAQFAGPGYRHQRDQSFATWREVADAPVMA